LICLPSYIDGNGLAGRVAYAWNALSHACHHHAYELAPTLAELADWIRTVERLQAVERGELTHVK
jgi:hypothetical protein